MTRWLHKRGRIWHYRFKVGGLEYAGTTECIDLASAKVVLEQVRRETILGNHGMAKAPTLAAVITEWLGTRGKSASKGHRRAAEQSRDALGGLVRLPLDRITTPLVEAWKAGHKATHSEASTNLVLRYLKLWMRWALGQKLIREMPYQVRMSRPQQRPRPVVEDVDGFLARVDKDHRNPQVPAAVRFAMMLGLREGEVLQARWEWLRDGSYTVAGNTKSKRTRAVPVPDALRVALLQMLAAIANGPAQWPRLGLIFPGKDGKPHKQGWLRPALKRGGVDGLGMHRLRATFATLHLRNRAPLKEVQEMMGHGDARTTLLYQEGSQEEKRRHQNNLWGQGA